MHESVIATSFVNVNGLRFDRGTNRDPMSNGSLPRPLLRRPLPPQGPRLAHGVVRGRGTQQF